MESDGYKVDGVITTSQVDLYNDLILDASGNVDLIKSAISHDLQCNFLHRSNSDTLQKAVQATIDKMLKTSSISISTHKLDVVTVDIAPSVPATFNITLSTKVNWPIHNLSVAGLFIDRGTTWSDFEQLDLYRKLRKKREDIGSARVTKAKLLMLRAISENLKQTEDNWIVTIDIFLLTSKEEIVEFLIHPSETIREVAKARITQLENNKN